MSKRRKNDFYPTPQSATQELLKHINITHQTSILEPCSGDNDISRELSTISDNIITNDIDSVRTSDFHLDATNQLLYDLNSVDWTITNPPFNQALDILKKAHENSLLGVAFLLRLSFLEPTFERQDWLSKNPPTKLIVLPRISFTNDGKTDSVTCAWLIWEKGKETDSIQIARKSKRGR